jgi:hypothetical protein
MLVQPRRERLKVNTNHAGLGREWFHQAACANEQDFV